MKTNKNPLSEIERIAVAGAMGKVDDLKKTLAPGTSEGSVVLKIDYVVDRAENTDIAPTASILSANVLAKAVVSMGAVGENFLVALRKAALEAIADKEKIGDAVQEADARVIAAFEAIKAEVVAKLPRTPKSGTTKVTATITKVTAGAVQEEA